MNDMNRFALEALSIAEILRSHLVLSHLNSHFLSCISHIGIVSAFPENVNRIFNKILK